MDSNPSAVSDRATVFRTELLFIQDPRIRNLVLEILQTVPEYFFHIPASSTGKYHPAYALGEGGLVRHVRATVYIANSLFEMEPARWPQTKRDLILAALILHDCFKNGDGSDKYTVTNHPNLMAEHMVVRMWSTDRDDLPSSPTVDISQLIRTHMGRWTTDSKTGKKVLEEPQTEEQKFVHLVDYLASRRFLEVNFAACI